MYHLYGHTVSEGGKNFQRRYLQKLESRKQKKQFQLINKDDFVAPDEIFEAVVGKADYLTINKDDYIHLVERSKISLNILTVNFSVIL